MFLQRMCLLGTSSGLTSISFLPFLVPVLFIVGPDPVSSYFVRSIIIWLNDFVVIALIFGHLIYAVHFLKAESDCQASVRTMMATAVRDYHRRTTAETSTQHAVNDAPSGWNVATIESNNR